MIIIYLLIFGVAIAIDASHISKGKTNPYIGKFWSGCAYNDGADVGSRRAIDGYATTRGHGCVFQPLWESQGICECGSECS